RRDAVRRVQPRRAGRSRAHHPRFLDGARDRPSRRRGGDGGDVAGRGGCHGGLKAQPIPRRGTTPALPRVGHRREPPPTISLTKLRPAAYRPSTKGRIACHACPATLHGGELMMTCIGIRKALIAGAVAASVALGTAPARADGNLNNVNHIIII